ncbi:MAG: peptidoglycan editing factor PgeF [Armatimonadota bacterium]|nr:peptidoglycan editing factor PgeF [Armatimonadota bacterium]
MGRPDPPSAGALPPLPAGWRWAAQDGLYLLHAESLRALGVSHAFTTRPGGRSAAPFDTLNLGRGVGDAPEAVRQNRTKVLAALGRPLRDHVEASQVHGANAAIVGALQRGEKISGVDILLTRDPAVVLAVHCADCVPVLLADTVRGAVAAVHTGWRGAAAGASAAAVRAMAEAFGSRPADLIAAVGPSIGPCCYEVDAAVMAGFSAWPWRGDVFVARRLGRWMLDLWEANRRQLVGAGVRPEAVSMVRLCTSCHRGLFFSHRRDRVTGRMAGLIAVSRP